MLEILSQGPIFIGCLVFVLGFVVLIHELGHYWAGRWYGAAVESFSIGFGSSIFERTDKNGTRWRVNWIPLGGFVKFVGESQMPGDVGKVEQGPVGKSYNQVGVGARSIVSIAGPVANFVLAVLLFAMIFFVNGSVEIPVRIASVMDDHPAAEAGFQPGDILVSVDDKPVKSSQDLLMAVGLGTGTPLTFVVERDSQLETLNVVPVRKMRENAVGQIVPQGTIGVSLEPMVERAERISYGPVGALAKGGQETVKTIGMTFNVLGRIVTGYEPVSTLSGPVAMGDAGRRVFNMTIGNEQLDWSVRFQAFFWTMVNLCAVISIGVGFANLLPLPVLDGGHLVFNAYEAVMGKTMPAKVQEMALMGGLCLLLTLFVFITWGDILETGLLSWTTG